MPPRQVWLFQLGCWVAFATAIVHLAEHVSGLNALPPETVAHVNSAHATYVIVIPGLHQPTFLGVLNGFSLSLSLLVATIGAAVEVFSFSARNPGHPVSRLIHSVGHGMQSGFATREPSPGDLLVGRAAMEALLRAEGTG